MAAWRQFSHVGCYSPFGGCGSEISPSIRRQGPILPWYNRTSPPMPESLVFTRRPRCRCATAQCCTILAPRQHNGRWITSQCCGRPRVASKVCPWYSVPWRVALAATDCHPLCDRRNHCLRTRLRSVSSWRPQQSLCPSVFYRQSGVSSGYATQSLQSRSGRGNSLVGSFTAWSLDF